MLKQRMEILKQGGVIGEDTARFMGRVIDMVASARPHIETDRAIMFTTHLAMAVERIRKGEAVEMMDDALWEDVRGCPEYPAARAFCDGMLPFSPVIFPESERKFILLHICSLLQV